MSRVERLTAADLVDPQLSASERAQKKQRWPKDKLASETPHSNNLVPRAYEHVLFLEAMPSRYRGLASIFGAGLLVGSILGYRGIDLGGRLISLTWQKEGFGFLLILGVALLTIVTTTVLIAFIAAIRTFRIDLLAPKEIPLIFNRKTRKVYRFVQDVPGFEQLAGPDGKFHLRGLGRYLLSTFLPWPNMLLVEYDWDCLEAEYYEVTALAGKVVRTDHHLDLYVRESPGSDKVIGSFALTPSVTTGEETGRDLWEHVRRFMEENGPALSPGDQPASPPPKGFWQAANAPFNGPGWLVFLAGAIWTWDKVYWNFLFFTTDYRNPANEARWMEILRHIDVGWVQGFVIFISYISMAWIFFAVIASYLSKHVDLPEDLIQEAGPAVDLCALAGAQAIARSM